MNFIVFDLEATCWEGRPPNMVQEIIEIGALKLDQYGELQGVFNRFVRPVINPTLSLFCRKLTSIDQIEVNRAETLPGVLTAFQDWAEEDDDCLFCSWGSFDKNIVRQNADLHRMESDWMEDNHLNIRKQYHDIRGWNTYRGLKKVVELEGFEFTGVYHRAISDAENLAKVFVKYIDMWRF
jgi:inhibitor of KinA sporulation pathway (predicted exonuclease)